MDITTGMVIVSGWLFFILAFSYSNKCAADEVFINFEVERRGEREEQEG